MATYTKETALYDTAAIAGDIQEAGTTASKYIAADSTGIMVYDGTSGAQTPSAVSDGTNNVFIDDDSVDVRTGSDVKASFGSITTIGPEDSAHAEIQEDSFTIYNGVPTECFKIESSSQTAPAVVAHTYDDDVGIVYSGTTSTGSKSKTYSDISTPFGVYVQALHGSEIARSTAYAYGESSSSTFTTRTFEFRSLKIQVKLNLVKSTSALTVKIESGYILSGHRTRSLTFKVVQYRKEQEVPAPTFLYGSLSSGSSIGAYSSAMGRSLNASGNYAFAEGYSTKAKGNQSHAEGSSTTASETGSHAEGISTTASGSASHAEGRSTIASGVEAHSEGYITVASGDHSHAQNRETIARTRGQTSIGEFNIADTAGSTSSRGNYSLIIGNGESDTARSNALTVDWHGNVNIASGAAYKINGTALAASDIGAVPTTRTVNSKALSADISLAASDIGAVPTTRKVNSKALSADISLTASDVGAVPTTRTVNSKALSADISLTASDVGAVPTTRTVNSKALSADISLTASDVGAVPTTRTVNGHALSADVADADYVTEQGTSSSWNYRKWKSGKIEAWRNYEFASASWTVWTSPIRYMDKTISIPSGIFSAAPSIMATSASTQYWVVGCTASSATAGSLRLATVSSTAMATTVRLYAYTV